MNHGGYKGREFLLILSKYLRFSCWGFGVKIPVCRYPASHFSLGYASQLISPRIFSPLGPIEVPQVLLLGFGVRIPVRRYPALHFSLGYASQLISPFFFSLLMLQSKYLRFSWWALG